MNTIPFLMDLEFRKRTLKTWSMKSELLLVVHKNIQSYFTAYNCSAQIAGLLSEEYPWKTEYREIWSILDG